MHWRGGVPVLVIIDDDGGRAELVAEVVRGCGLHPVVVNPATPTIVDHPTAVIVVADAFGRGSPAEVAALAVPDDGPPPLLVELDGRLDATSTSATAAPGATAPPAGPVPLGELAPRLARAAALRVDALTTLLARKDALVERLVHDLGSPLASAILSLQDALAAEPSPAGGRASLGAVETAARIAMNLLDLVRDRPVVARPTWCTPTAWLEQAMPRLAPRLEVRKVGLAVAGSSTRLWADATLGGRLVETLLEHAVRSAPSGSEVTVTFRRDRAGVTLEVVDRGAPIEGDERRRVFERFAAVEAGASRRVAAGIGLAFCARAIAAHQGTIAVDSPDGGGARFQVWFPDPAGDVC